MLRLAQYQVFSTPPCYFNWLKSILIAFLVLQAWNIESSTELNLYGPVGQVHCMDVGNGMLFVGTQVNREVVLLLSRIVIVCI